MEIIIELMNGMQEIFINFYFLSFPFHLVFWSSIEKNHLVWGLVIQSEMIGSSKFLGFFVKEKFKFLVPVSKCDGILDPLP